MLSSFFWPEVTHRLLWCQNDSILLESLRFTLAACQLFYLTPLFMSPTAAFPTDINRFLLLCVKALQNWTLKQCSQCLHTTLRSHVFRAVTVASYVWSLWSFHERSSLIISDAGINACLLCCCKGALGGVEQSRVLLSHTVWASNHRHSYFCFTLSCSLEVPLMNSASFFYCMVFKSQSRFVSVCLLNECQTL